MTLRPMAADTLETSPPRYPTRRGWRQRQGRWVRGALAAAGATAVLWSSACRTAGEPPPANIEQTRTGGTPPPVDPVKPPESVQEAQVVKPPEADGGPVVPDVTRTAGVPAPVTLPTPAPPQPAPPVQPAPPAPDPPAPRLSGAVARPDYPVR